MVDASWGEFEKHFRTCKLYSKFIKKTSSNILFECTECPGKYTGRINIFKHIKETHFNKQFGIKQDEKENFARKKCEYCNVTTSNYENHVKICKLSDRFITKMKLKSGNGYILKCQIYSSIHDNHNLSYFFPT